MDYQKIIEKYYPDDGDLRRLLLKHSRQVADRTLLIAGRHPEWALDKEFLEAAAMLHDIGIVRCNAPGIYCYGTEPYISHGQIGGQMLRNLNDPSLCEGRTEALARVCERHTGTGLSGWEPETLEEQLICYADKFYSKSSPDHEKTLEEAMRSLQKFGPEGVERLKAWAEKFEGK